MKPQRIFIACAPQDLPYAIELRTHLAAAGHQPWLEDTSAASLPPGPERDAANREAIKRADALVIPLTPYALAWPGLRQEWLLARLQYKPVLLLLVQSVASTDLLAALHPGPSDGRQSEDRLAGSGPGMDSELLHWIDVRARPAEAAWRTVDWLENRSGTRHDLLPDPVEPDRFYAEVMPRPARMYAWSQLSLAGLGIVLALGALLRLAVLQLGPAPVVFMDQFFITLLICMCGSVIYGLARLGWNGIETFHRRCKSPREALRPLQYSLFLLAGLLGILGLAAYTLGKTAFLNGALYPMRSLAWGLSLGLVGLAFFLPQGLARRFATLRAWLPRVEPAELRASTADWPQEAAAGLPAARNGNRPAASALGQAGRPPGAPARKPPAVSRPGSPFRFRLAMAHAQPDIAGGNAAVPANLGLISAIHERPNSQVSVLFAPQDAPFGRSLIQFLGENGLKVQYDISESIQAHVNARINLGAAHPQGKATLILVLSPWVKETVWLRNYWQSAQAAGMPILPVLLEDTTLPREIGHLEWVDARRGLPRAYQQILETVLREREQPPAPTPAPPEASAVAQPGSRRRAAVFPRSLQLAQGGLYFSAAYKLFALAVLFPMALWLKPPLDLGLGLAAGLLFVTTYIQLATAMLFFMRRLSFPWMLLVQWNCLLAGVVSLPFLRSDLLWPVSSLAQITLLIPAWEAAVLLWLLLVAEIRHWALGGFWLRLRNVEISSQTVLYSLAPLCLALLFLLPAFKAGPAPQLRGTTGKLAPGETVLVSTPPQAPDPDQDPGWTIQASQGDLITIQADGGFSTSQITFNIQYGNEKNYLAWSHPTLGRAIISSLLLPKDGEYRIHLAEPPARGLFRFSYTVGRPDRREVKCGTGPWKDHLEVGQSLAWKFNAQAGQNLKIQMDALGWTLDPWMGLYNPSGNLMVVNDDRGSLMNALIPGYYADQTGKYTLLTSGQTGTWGDFEVQATCDN